MAFDLIEGEFDFPALCIEFCKLDSGSFANVQNVGHQRGDHAGAGFLVSNHPNEQFALAVAVNFSQVGAVAHALLNFYGSVASQPPNKCRASLNELGPHFDSKVVTV